MFHDSFTCDTTHLNVPWLIYLWYDSFKSPGLPPSPLWQSHWGPEVFMCDMTHSYVTWLITSKWVMKQQGIATTQKKNLKEGNEWRKWMKEMTCHIGCCNSMTTMSCLDTGRGGIPLLVFGKIKKGICKNSTKRPKTNRKLKTPATSAAETARSWWAASSATASSSSAIWIACVHVCVCIYIYTHSHTYIYRSLSFSQYAYTHTHMYIYM